MPYKAVLRIQKQLRSTSPNQYWLQQTARHSILDLRVRFNKRQEREWKNHMMYSKEEERRGLKRASMHTHVCTPCQPCITITTGRLRGHHKWSNIALFHQHVIISMYVGAYHGTSMLVSPMYLSTYLGTSVFTPAVLSCCVVPRRAHRSNTLVMSLDNTN